MTISTLSTSSLKIDWTAVSGASSYRVLRATASGGPYTEIGTPTAATFTDGGLAAGTRRFYVVEGVNAGGNSASSSEVSAFTLPAAPSGVSAIATSSSTIHIDWSDVTSATSYRVLRSTTTGGPYAEIGTPTSSVFNDSSLGSNVTRFYVVQAVNPAGDSASSAEVSTTTLLVAPTGLTASATNSSTIHLSWTARSGATGYKVVRATTSGGPYTQVGTPAGTTFDDSGLTPETKRFYVVRATNAGGDSANSSEASATTDLACSDSGADDTPTGATAMGGVGWDGGSGPDTVTQTSRSICQGDVDWYFVNLQDSSACAPFQLDEDLSASFALTMSTTPIHGNGDLDLFVFYPDSSTQAGSSVHTGTAAESFLTNTGACGLDDGATAFIKVVGFGAAANSYSLSVTGDP